MLGFCTCLALCTGCSVIPTTALSRWAHEQRAVEVSREELLQAEACRAAAEELAMAERDEQAIAQFLRARTLNPAIRRTAHPLAVLYDRQRLLDQAEREYLAALKELPREADVANDYGFFLYSRGEHARAEESLRRALRLQPKHAQARLNLAMVLAAQERFDECYAEFSRAVGPASAHYNTAVLLLRADRHADGLQHLRKALAVDPGLQAARMLLASPAIQSLEANESIAAQ